MKNSEAAGGGGALLYILVRKGLSDKIIFEKRPEIMRKSVPWQREQPSNCTKKI